MPGEADYIKASEQADDLASAGRNDEAIALVAAALEEARGAGDAAYALLFEGELANCAGDYGDQLDLQLKAAKLRPDSHPILRNVGVALSKLGRQEEAVEWFDRALTRRPDDPRSLSNRGAVLMGLGRYEAALGDLDRALALRPGSLHALAHRAVLVGLLGRTREAVETLREYLGTNRSNAWAKLWLARFAGSDEAQSIISEIDAQHRQEETQRAAAERESRDRQIKLAAWRTLSARSSHRIGNQLFAARGAVRTLRKVEDAETAEAVADLDASLDRMRRIVQEFQMFSRSQEPRPLPTDVGRLVGNIVRRYASLAEETHVTAEVAAELPRCSADRAQLDQAFGELLENALRHTPKGGSIDVTAEPVEVPGGRRVRVVVADTGPGIPEADKEAVFRPFVSRRPGGSGLGLAIVKQIVENHGGTIRETGTEGEGARFEIELPALPDEEASDEAADD